MKLGIKYFDFFLHAEVQEFLTEIGLEHLHETFEDNDVNGETLLGLTAEASTPLLLIFYTIEGIVPNLLS
jgi:hypothetical protein